MLGLLAGEEIEKVAELAARRPIDLSVFTLRASDRAEPFALYVKYFGQESASSSEFVGLMLRVFALRAGVPQFHHLIILHSLAHKYLIIPRFHLQTSSLG